MLQCNRLALACKLLVNWASGAWAIRVLMRDEALAKTSYAAVTRIVPENLIAAIVLAVVASNLALLVLYFARRLPRGSAATAAGYFVLLFGWSGVMFAVMIADPPQPTAFSTVSTVCAVAFVALVTRLSDDADAT